MKLRNIFVFILAMFLFACEEEELLDPYEILSVTKKVSNKIDSLEIEGYVKIITPSNSFSGETNLTLKVTENPIFDNDLSLIAPMYFIDDRSNYEIIVVTENTRPKEYTNVIFDIPGSLNKSGYGYSVFAKFYDAGDNEELYYFRQVESEYDNRKLSINLSPSYFKYNEKNNFIAILKIANFNAEAYLSNTIEKKSYNSGDCEGMFIRCPLSSCNRTSPFCCREDCSSVYTLQNNNINKLKPCQDNCEIKSNTCPSIIDAEYISKCCHFGIDYEAFEGRQVFAARKGKVVAKNSGGGWGDYLVLEHGNIGTGRKLTTLYAHLSSRNVSLGEEIEEGEQIGLAGKTGTKSAHLHFEYALLEITANPLSNQGYSQRTLTRNPENCMNKSKLRLSNPKQSCPSPPNNCQHGGVINGGTTCNLSIEFDNPYNISLTQLNVVFECVNCIWIDNNGNSLGTINELDATPIISNNKISTNFCSKWGSEEELIIMAFVKNANGEESDKVKLIFDKPLGANKKDGATPSIRIF